MAAGQPHLFEAPLDPTVFGDAPTKESFEIPDNVGQEGVTIYRKHDIDYLKDFTEEWTAGFKVPLELMPSNQHDIVQACKWVRECVYTNFNNMARAGGWRKYNPPENMEKETYNPSTDTVALLLVFGEEIKQEQIARSVHAAFFDGMKNNQPEGCDHKGVILMHSRGFPVTVPSGTRCVVFKCWIRFVKRVGGTKKRR